jgi:hypothetical protein
MRTRTDRDLYTQAIERLVDYYGSYERPSRILNVSTTDLHRWAHGKARPPTDAFLKVLYLNEEDSDETKDASCSSSSSRLRGIAFDPGSER